MKNKILCSALLALSVTTSLSAKAIKKNEATAPFLKTTEITKLDEMQKRDLLSGSVGKDIWSGHYWPFYMGSLGLRFMDPEFMTLVQDEDSRWEDFKKLYEARPLAHYTRDQLIELSPAEKYDLLIGDQEFTFTKSQWKKGQGQADSHFGKVAIWRGICNGWAAATLNLPRPVNSVTLKAADGKTDITFTPDDLKALGSQLNAAGDYQAQFIGTRCTKNPFSFLAGSCDETNPGALHRILVNLVGVERKSIVADLSPGTEVWNYPVTGYKMSFFNVMTKAPALTYQEAMTRITSANKEDIPKSISRSEKAVALVGVKLHLIAKDMVKPVTETSDNGSHDKNYEVDMEYDLELDSAGNIIGGEWHSKNGPDFMWAPMAGSLPVATLEKSLVLEYNPYNPISSSLAALAKKAAKEGQPLSVIVNRLFELAK